METGQAKIATKHFKYFLDKIIKNKPLFTLEELLQRSNPRNPNVNIKFALISYAMSLPLGLFGVDEGEMYPDNQLIEAMLRFLTTSSFGEPSPSEITFNYGQEQLTAAIPGAQVFGGNCIILTHTTFKDKERTTPQEQKEPQFSTRIIYDCTTKRFLDYIEERSSKFESSGGL